MKTLHLVLILLLVGGSLKAQEIERARPAHWWTGMKNSELQITFHGKNIGELSSVSVDYPGVFIKEIVRPANPNYLFLYLEIGAETKPGKLDIKLANNSKSISYKYELKERREQKGAKGFGPEDLVYLIMPDRFANGDPKNDDISGMLEKSDRNKPYGRHGGDLKGITDNLDYIKELGVTAVWLNPVLENDQPSESYHGYAATDLYAVDRRFGGNDAYTEFINRAHEKGLKIIMDLVHNHVGSEHWFVKDRPGRDWLNSSDKFVQSSFRTGVTSDPYASEADINKMNDGWFNERMPDLNQRNRLLADYLIQNNIWWIEESQIDGIRMDTYPYPEKKFMARWIEEVLAEYPDFNIVGEVWTETQGAQTYWQNRRNADGYQPNLPSVTDFYTFLATGKAFNEPSGWSSGMMQLYYALGHDHLYEKPEENLIFLDNHDVTRFYTQVGKRPEAVKAGLAFLLTTRGVPQVYYGTEILSEGVGNEHSTLRKDFPGGWAGDSVNVFKNKGLTKEQAEMSAYFRKLANWRKTASAVHSGKLMHFVPDNNVYVYFRYNEAQTVMVIINFSDKDLALDTGRFQEKMQGFSRASDVMTDKTITDLSKIDISKKTALILELE